MLTACRIKFCVVMFTERRLKPVERRLPRGESSLMVQVTNLRTKSPVEDFYCDKVRPVHASDVAVCYRNDIYMVLNQYRLDTMTLSQFSEWLNHDQSAGQFASIRKKMTDEQLHMFVKSRYLQHPSELRAWTAYLDACAEKEISDINAKIKSEAEARKAAEVAKASEGAAAAASGPAVSGSE